MFGKKQWNIGLTGLCDEDESVTTDTLLITVADS